MVTMETSLGCRRASLSAAATLQPLEMPQNTPSSAASRRAASTPSSVVAVMTPARSETSRGQIDVALAAFGEDELGAVRAHDLLALVAHPFGHHDRARVALDRRHPRARDTGIAGRALQHAHARSQRAAPLGALEHVQI